MHECKRILTRPVTYYHLSSQGSLVLLAKAQRLGYVSRSTYLLIIPVCCVLLSVSPLSARAMKGAMKREGVRARQVRHSPLLER